MKIGQYKLNIAYWDDVLFHQKKKSKTFFKEREVPYSLVESKLKINCQKVKEPIDKQQ